MNRSARVRVVMAATAGASLFLSACGAGSDAGGDTEAASSPLAEFLGQPTDFESEEAQAEMIAQQREANELIVACMSEQGFEYIPDNPEQFMSFDSADSEGIEWGTREYVEKYGFGITTQRWDAVAVGPNLIGYDSEAMGGGQEYVDPNADYVQSLSEAEQTAYYAALYGEDPGFTWDDTLTEEENNAAMEEFYADYVPTGCQNEAYNQGDQGKINEFYTEFEEELNAIYEQALQDPRYIEATAKVKACVEEKGLEYVPEEELYNLWETDLSDIETNHVVYPGNDLTDADYETMSPEELDAIFSQPVTIDDDGKAKLAELQEKEIALAIAYDDCGGGYAKQSELQMELQQEYEQKFLDENADRLAEFQGVADTSGQG